MKLRIQLLLFSSFIFFSCGGKQEAKKEIAVEQDTRPNIIFVFADDWGYGDLGVHGSTFCKTPNLDKMAVEGIDFQNFSVVNPVCSPSRVGVMTGQFPARQSVHGHFASVESHMQRGMPDWLNPQAPLLPKMLKEAGYATAHFGKWHLSNTHVEDAPSPLEYGYDEYGAFNLPSKLHQMQADSTLYKTIDFVKRNKEKPFFVNAWIHATHTPHYPKEKYMRQFAHLNEQQQVYAAVIAEYDARIGELFETLKNLGLDENTLVVFSSDNGPEITGKKKIIEDNSTGPGMGTYYSVGETAGLKGEKRSLFAGGVRIPFLVRWPGKTPAGVVDKTTELATVDLLPTFLELAKTTYPENYEPDGVSIVPAIMGKPFERQKPIFWDWRFPNDRPDFWPSAGVQEGNWKLLANEELGREELYDITSDWAEQKDMSAENPQKVKELMQKFKTFKKSLPIDPPSTCFSEVRSRLTSED
ncbi:sulfatase-like hydrolase/transferase [Zobellia galactanivorans]|uniref:Sulfatase, family S1-22 n=1 Tax=Zobellia galactanivorans (strain DSM 12802 / CCUG 47099 / CIP 106680 / NCIMB 13871 / Dsij) TaxID=63186 RepID=G0L8I9_ZOBGA|nr:sulfatase-like hydrolase/transferase [Zobellia galactanivorans]CAZ97604.1 Sulfatase, family S1-22 [Zobellia galactanivorans]